MGTLHVRVEHVLKIENSAKRSKYFFCEFAILLSTHRVIVNLYKLNYFICCLVNEHYRILVNVLSQLMVTEKYQKRKARAGSYRLLQSHKNDGRNRGYKNEPYK